MTANDVYLDTVYKSGQDSLSFADFVRMLNMALATYADIRITANGIWGWDDTTHVDSEGDPTGPTATATLGAGESTLELDADFLAIRRVTLDGDILTPIRSQDYTGITASELYGTGAQPRHYSYEGNVLRFYPSTDIARTVTVEFARMSPELDSSDTATTLGVPRFHMQYLSLHVRNQLAERTNDPNITLLERRLAEEEDRIREYASKRDQNLPRELRHSIHVPN